MQELKVKNIAIVGHDTLAIKWKAPEGKRIEACQKQLWKSESTT